ncbi:hypothetical protein CVT24_009397 [Panaeolus cyanescens]|uniref:Uncharacterized protein n=1 Tax=Panaeolus cyanescens TaxID=181874 RepID=A0A409VAT2_9AGAR|nr:hypothetical protein CVT24_009397 [Panaeolus cyanescens]
MVYKAVIFDIGGVVLRSPFIAIAAYERKLGLPVNYLNCSMCVLANIVVTDSHDLAIAIPKLPQTLKVDGRELFGSMMREAHQYDPYVREAILRIRACGKFKVIALTNNFAKVNVPEEEREFLGWSDQGAVPDELKSLFDDFCDSSSLGMRKPEKRFYMLACERSEIKPSEAIFLDDIGL